MDPDELDQRLSRITTQWTAVFAAHHGSTTTSAKTREDLLARYVGAVYRYLLGATHDADVAQELSHEFAIRFLKGDFHRASPERGKFRNYLKTALINLVNDHHRSRQNRPRAFESGLPEPAVPQDDSFDTGEQFAICWREEVMERTWASLKSFRDSYYRVLRLRVENPDLPARAMAEQVSRESEKPLTPATVRKTLERARIKFADLLVDEVAMSLESDDLGSLQAELRELDLLRYCRSALERRRGNN